MFEKLADFIMKNAKLIIVLWIVALLISVPFLAKSNSVLQYDMSKLGTKTPLESLKGQEILSSGEFNSGSGASINGGTIIHMLFEKVADSIMKHAKLIICIWIVLLIASVPFVYKVLVKPEDVLQYDMTTMIDPNSESVRGMVIIQDPNYFYQSDMGTDMILVVECKSLTQKGFIENDFYNTLRTNLFNKYGADKMSVMSLGFSSKYGGNDGIEMISIAFTDERNSAEEVTPIRGVISDTKAQLYDPEKSYTSLTTYLTGSTPLSSFDVLPSS